MLSKIFHNKVFKNFSYLTIGSALSQVFSLLTILKITKLLHPDDYGLYSFIIAQGTLIMTIADLGIMMIVVRSIARDPQRTNDLVYNGMLLRIISILGMAGVYIGYNYFLGNLSGFEMAMVFLFALISCFGKIFETAFLGHQIMLPTAIINFSSGFLWFVYVFLAPVELIQVNYLVVAFLILNVIKNLAYYFSLKKFNLLLGKIGDFWTSSKRLLKESWPYFALTLVAMPYTKFSNNFLDINSSIDEVAFYNLSDKFTGPISMVLDMALIAIFPNFSALWITNKGKFKKTIQDNFKYFMLLGMVLCFLFTVFAMEILGFLFPASYLPAVFVCQIQIWVLFLNSVNSLMGTILGSTDNEKKILKIGIVNMLFSTPIVYFGSYYGALGLSIAYLSATALFQFYIWYVFQKTISIKIKDSFLMGGLAILLFLSSYFLLGEINILFKILIAALVLLTSGWFSKNLMVKGS
ncbi:oligosaccharide flippase family protein [Cecembia lonarensis]|uniref:Polysaccharide biosynthesis protein n=1 Tax=Cecembia lonarensis (strain CCUG 58316 / KCTC 22772 / LW9) TaxID=1225176 RepID=K1LGL7_CECL9|nr:oligosaccharide flippase family protein [Cecembia lonarensis]EKB51322.1 Polysaccharide biosynthesis protein [Cecembia lonarensis LW9]